jgi:hypothetical protein
MNIYQKLNAARDKFHSQEIRKSGLNKFAGYKYFELGDFIIPALKIFSEIGITSVIRFENEYGFMELINTSEPSERILFSSPMSEASLKGCHPVQNLGAVETYIRRYLWVCALEIVEHDALDSADPKDVPVKNEIRSATKEEKKEAEKKESKKKAEPVESDDAFIEILLAWAVSCNEPEELASIWKANQKRIDAIKKSLPDQYAIIVERFTTIKTNLLNEEK